jgi:hypothetical protein
MEAEEIKDRVSELSKQYDELDRQKNLILKEYNSYFYSINIDYASDLFVKFSKENPEHPLLQYCKEMEPEHSGHLSDVRVKILKHEITKADFIEFVRLIAPNYRGEDSIRRFEFFNKNE